MRGSRDNQQPAIMHNVSGFDFHLNRMSGGNKVQNATTSYFHTPITIIRIKAEEHKKHQFFSIRTTKHKIRYSSRMC